MQSPLPLLHHNKTQTNKTNCVEQSSFWEANSSSASQEIPRTLRYLMVHYRLHKSYPLLPIPSQIIHSKSSQRFLQDPFWNCTYLSSCLPGGHFPSGFPTKTLYKPFLSPIRSTFFMHLFPLDLINRIVQGSARNVIPLIVHITHFYCYKSIWHPVQN